MIELRDTPTACRFLDLLWAEAQRQSASIAPPQENKERDESPSRHAQSR